MASGVPVHGVDFDRRAVILGDGTQQSFDDLVIATGRRARSWPGRTPATGVFTSAHSATWHPFAAAAVPRSRVVIIGAGFIGCEVAATLRARDVEVTVVDVSDAPMPVIGPEAGARARQLHERHGVRWRLGASVDAIEGEEHVTGVRLGDGEVLDADLVLVSIGSVPNTEWLADSPSTSTPVSCAWTPVPGTGSLRDARCRGVGGRGRRGLDTPPLGGARLRGTLVQRPRYGR